MNASGCIAYFARKLTPSLTVLCTEIWSCTFHITCLNAHRNYFYYLSHYFMLRSSSCSKKKQQLHNNTTWPWDRLGIFSSLSCNPVWMSVFAVADGGEEHSYVLQDSTRAVICFTKSSLILAIQHFFDQGNRILAGQISNRLCSHPQWE